MCGIVGVVRPTPLASDDAAVAAGVRAMRHRGPDAQRVIRLGDAIFGVARLSIEGGVAGAQPMRGAGPNTLFAYNGELYGERSHVSDTAQVLATLINRGAQALLTAHGMFALALWRATPADPPTLTLARDRFGQKPLYLAPLRGGGVAFASLPKAMRAIEGIDWSIDHHALHAMLRHGFIPGTRTGWTGVRKIRAGEIVRWTRHQTVSTSVGLPAELGDRTVDPSDALARVHAAVEACLPSDAPTGVLLSGGLDSGVVAAIARERLRGAWTLRWNEAEWDESAHAAELARHLGIRHHEVPCTARDLAHRLDELVDAVDEPMADESILPTTLVCEAASTHVRVVLGGDGADELFGGYGRYGWQGDLAAYRDIFIATPSETIRRIAPGLAPEDQWLDERLAAVRALSTLQQRRWLDLHGYLPDQVLTKLDRASMWVGLEARAPLLAPGVAAWGLGLSDAGLRREGIGKVALREAAAGLLPSSTRMRPKRGFGVPTCRWFRGSLSAWVRDRLHGGALGRLPWLELDQVGALLSEHQSSVAQHARPLFGLLWLEAWVRREAAIAAQ